MKNLHWQILKYISAFLSQHSDVLSKHVYKND